MIVASRITLSSYTRCFQTLPSSTELEPTHRQGHLNFKDWKGSGSFKPGRCWGNSKNITHSSVKVSYGWHQWQLPQSQKRLLAHSLVVVLTSNTAKGAGQFSGCALKSSCQLQRKGSRYPQGRTKHQRQTPGLSQPSFGLDCTT